jgi:hypothetical protein
VKKITYVKSQESFLDKGWLNKMMFSILVGYLDGGVHFEVEISSVFIVVLCHKLKCSFLLVCELVDCIFCLVTRRELILQRLNDDIKHMIRTCSLN